MERTMKLVQIPIPPPATMVATTASLASPMMPDAGTSSTSRPWMRNGQRKLCP
jgi:hypothetical protein